jgi:hypothetical protein
MSDMANTSYNQRGIGSNCSETEGRHPLSVKKNVRLTLMDECMPQKTDAIRKTTSFKPTDEQAFGQAVWFKTFRCYSQHTGSCSGPANFIVSSVSAMTCQEVIHSLI